MGKEKKEQIVLAICMIIAFVIFMKMCSVSADTMYDREPLYEIDNWE